MMYSIGFILTAFAVQSIYGDLVHGKLSHILTKLNGSCDNFTKNAYTLINSTCTNYCFDVTSRPTRALISNSYTYSLKLVCYYTKSNPVSVSSDLILCAFLVSSRQHKVSEHDQKTTISNCRPIGHLH